jgi:hypothetical protein
MFALCTVPNTNRHSVLVELIYFNVVLLIPGDILTEGWVYFGKSSFFGGKSSSLLDSTSVSQDIYGKNVSLK